MAKNNVARGADEQGIPESGVHKAAPKLSVSIRDLAALVGYNAAGNATDLATNAMCFAAFELETVAEALQSDEVNLERIQLQLVTIASRLRKTAELAGNTGFSNGETSQAARGCP